MKTFRHIVLFALLWFSLPGFGSFGVTSRQNWELEADRCAETLMNTPIKMGDSGEHTPQPSIHDFKIESKYPLAQAAKAMAEETLTMRYPKLEIDTTATLLEQADQVLWHIIDHRMSLLDRKSYAEVKATLGRGKVKHTDDINGLVEIFRGSQFELEIPKHLYQTPITGHALLHELEHAIQGAKFRRLFEKNPGMKVVPKGEAVAFATDSRFFIEMGAMAQEYHYLSMLPQPVRDWMVRDLEKTPALLDKGGPGYDLHRVLKSPFFSHPSASAHTYVYAQWKLGRYSYSHIEAEERVKRGSPR